MRRRCLSRHCSHLPRPAGPLPFSGGLMLPRSAATSDQIPHDVRDMLDPGTVQTLGQILRLTTVEDVDGRWGGAVANHLVRGRLPDVGDDIGTGGLASGKSRVSEED
jgi:hypothetical protein